MGLFDRFREKSHLEVKTNVASIVQQMFDEAGITPQCPNKNVGLPEFGVMGIANGILTIYTTYV